MPVPGNRAFKLGTGDYYSSQGRGSPRPVSRFRGRPEAVAMETRAAWTPPSKSHAFPLRWSLLIGWPLGLYHPPRTR